MQFLTAVGLSQNPSDVISTSSLNEKFLEHLIKEKIDEVRVQHNLKALYNDSILFVAAKYHAHYLFDKGVLSHFEKENPVTETPQKRVDYFGGINYLVGENVALSYVNIPTKGKTGKIHINQTYEQTAEDFVTMWVHSPGHFKNIITPQYNATGLAIWVDKKTNCIYSVQNFADILYKYSFEENKSFFPYSNFQPLPVISSFKNVDTAMHKGKHVYKIKSPKNPDECTRCKENQSNFEFGLTHIEHKGKYIYLVSYSYDAIINLLKKRRDGFAAEIVTYNPYDCGNPEYYIKQSRRNKQCEFSGIVLPPVYRKNALLGFKPGGKKAKIIKQKIEAGKVNKYMLRLGQTPKELQNYYEVNLVILQKKRVCRVVHFSSFCGDTLEKFYHLQFFLDNVSNKAEIKGEYKTMLLNIPFQKGDAEYKTARVKVQMDSLLRGIYLVDTVDIKAYSSIEGEEEVNKKLQEQRAEHIANAISAQQKEKIITKISSQENWDLFEKQISGNADLKEYKDLSKDKIKLVLKDSLKIKKIETYLNKQRVAHVKIHAQEIVTDENLEKYLTKKISTEKLKVNAALNDKTISEEEFLNKTNKLKTYMEFSYGKIKQGVLNPGFFKNFEVGQQALLNKYNLIRLKYGVQINPMKEDTLKWLKKVYDDLVSLYNNKEKSFFINYNLLHIIQEYGKEINVTTQEEEINNYINELKSFVKDSVEKDLTDKLALNFWFKVCRLPEQDVPKNKVPVFTESLKNIYDYFKDKNLPITERNKLAQFYLYHSKPQWVYDLLWPLYKEGKSNPESLKILAKTFYENYQETGNKDYYDFLEDIYPIMGKNNWCPMFVGPCNISFQVFDYENFRNFYCEKCSDFLNYVKSPSSK